MKKYTTGVLVAVIEDALSGLCDRADYGETPDGLKREDVEPTHMQALRALHELQKRSSNN